MRQNAAHDEAGMQAGLHEAGPGSTTGLSVESRRTRRKLYDVSIRWGLEAPTEEVGTEDISTEGLFLLTSSPPEPGTMVHMSLKTDAGTVPLKGMVVWTRKTEERGLPPGMGVQLIRPPALYIYFVNQLP